MSRKTLGERAVYTVSVDLPPGVSCTQMVKYLDAAWANFREESSVGEDSQTSSSSPIRNTTITIKLSERHVKYSR